MVLSSIESIFRPLRLVLQMRVTCQFSASIPRECHCPGALMGKLPDNLSIRIEIFRAGVTFDDGTIVREISAADFDETGRYYYPMIKPAELRGSTCHRTKIYIGGVFYGDVYIN